MRFGDTLPFSATRWEELLLTNTELHGLEYAKVKEIIETDTLRLAKLKRRGRKPQRQRLDEMEEVRDRLHCCNAIISPIRLLPTEILQRIFASLLDEELDGDGFIKESRKPIRAPWTLSRVSRRWRDASLSCPSLWSFIRVLNSADWTDLLVTQLRRTGSHVPLHVSICDAGRAEHSSAKALGTILAPWIHRCFMLQLALDSTALECFVSSLGHPFPLPSLHSLSIRFTHKERFVNLVFPEVSAFLENIPNVRILRAHSTDLKNFDLKSRGSPLWPNLRDYRGPIGGGYTQGHLSEHFWALSMMPNITSCSMFIATKLGLTTASHLPSPINLPHLRMLSVIEQTDLLRVLCSNIICPNLQIFQCSGMLCDSAITGIRALIEGSSNCSIRVLDVGNSVNALHLLPILPLLSYLRELHISDRRLLSTDPPSLLPFCEALHNDGAMLPDLRLISCDLYEGDIKEKFSEARPNVHLVGWRRREDNVEAWRREGFL